MKTNYWQTFYENAYYHIYNRTNGHDYLFANEGNYRYFLERWHIYFGNYLDTYAYCLMSNHFHCIVRVKPVDEAFKTAVAIETTVAARLFLQNKISLNTFLEDQFKRFFTSYAKSFNKQHDRHGSLLEKRFKRVQITEHLILLDKIAYVHHNPLHHNLSPFYEVWTYSSYLIYLSNKQTKLKRSEGLHLFDGQNGSVPVFEKYHQDFHRRWLNDQITDDFE